MNFNCNAKFKRSLRWSEKKGKCIYLAGKISVHLEIIGVDIPLHQNRVLWHDILQSHFQYLRKLHHVFLHTNLKKKKVMFIWALRYEIQTLASLAMNKFIKQNKRCENEVAIMIDKNLRNNVLQIEREKRYVPFCLNL